MAQQQPELIMQFQQTAGDMCMWEDNEQALDCSSTGHKMLTLTVSHWSQSSVAT